jgi:hypothetical protein
LSVARYLLQSYGIPGFTYTKATQNECRNGKWLSDARYLLHTYRVPGFTYTLTVRESTWFLYDIHSVRGSDVDDRECAYSFRPKFLILTIQLLFCILGNMHINVHQSWVFLLNVNYINIIGNILMWTSSYCCIFLLKVNYINLTAGGNIDSCIHMYATDTIPQRL